MAFNYQTLKRIRNDAIQVGQIQTANFEDNAIHTEQIAGGAVTSAKLASNAVSLPANTVTGTLPTSKGGTGRTSTGGNNQILAVNSANNGLEFKQHGLQGMSVYTSSTTWTKPAGVRFVKVLVTASGGGGSGHGESGGAGGHAQEIINVTNVSSVSVTVGGEGGGTYYSGAGGNANSASFGNYCSASGGRGANRNNQHSGGVGGNGSGGNINVYGGGGRPHHTYSSCGGDSFWGGPVPAGHPQGGQFSWNHRSHAAYGAGGSGGYFHGNRGANGRRGCVVIYNYY